MEHAGEPLEIRGNGNGQFCPVSRLAVARAGSRWKAIERKLGGFAPLGQQPSDILAAASTRAVVPSMPRDCIKGANRLEKVNSRKQFMSKNPYVRWKMRNNYSARNPFSSWQVLHSS